MKDLNPVSYVLMSAIGFVVILFLFVSISTPVRADSNTASVSVNVSSACTFDSAINSTHSAIVPSGTYKDSIGTTTLNVVCNDAEGYSIYAIGYSDRELGNSKLLATINGSPNPTYNINTGVNKSGDPSSWSMKLTPKTGLTSNNILNNYDDYNLIPEQYIKVATIDSSTNPSAGSIVATSLETTYAVNISNAQPAGDYQGKVKYTMVHPASNIPNQPISTNPGYISYNPNAEGAVADTMGDQSISASDTSAILWASNFRRQGYGFVGWSDKYDWVVNSNDTDGNGTGANAGYHIYGPNQTIGFTAGQYSGTNDGLSLYAVWVKSQGNLQNWNGCNVMNTGEVTALTDLRDNNTYAIAKLADGKCWMVENLRLGSASSVTMDSTSTNLTSGATFTLSASRDPSQNAWCSISSDICSDQSMLYAGNVIDTVVNMTSTDQNIYSYGNYYNWYSATAGTGTYSLISGNATGSICPAGWHLPSGGEVSGEFYTLVNAVTNSGYTESGRGLRAYPNNFVHSGHIYGQTHSLSGGSLYWSASSPTDSYGYAFMLELYGNIIDLLSTYSVVGQAVRCAIGV